MNEEVMKLIAEALKETGQQMKDNMGYVRDIVEKLNKNGYVIVPSHWCNWGD